MKKEIIMPKIGLDMEEGTIEQWLKKVGDTVKEGDPLVEIETDKAVTTVESALNGTLVEIAPTPDAVPLHYRVSRTEVWPDGTVALPVG